MRFRDKSSKRSLYFSGFTATTLHTWEEILTQGLRIPWRASKDYKEAVNILHIKWSQPSTLECDTDFDHFYFSWSFQTIESTSCTIFIFQTLQANLTLLKIHRSPFLISTRHSALNATVLFRLAVVPVTALYTTFWSSPAPQNTRACFADGGGLPYANAVAIFDSQSKASQKVSMQDFLPYGGIVIWPFL